MTLAVVPDPTTKSNPAVVALLRSWLDKAVNNEITSLYIEGIVDGEIKSVSLACRLKCSE